MNNLVSIQYAINKAMDNMYMDETDDVPILMDWALECDKDKIGSYYNYVERVHVLDSSDCKVALPIGTCAVVGVLIGDHGCDCGLLFDGSLVTSITGAVTSIGVGLVVINALQNRTQLSNARYTIQNNTLVFGRSLSSQKVTVKTLGYKLDDDGIPMINENHTIAIAAYLEWKVASRNRWKTRKANFGSGELREMERIFQDECADARARDNETTPSQDDALASIMNDPLSGFYNGMNLRSPEADYGFSY